MISQKFFRSKFISSNLRLFCQKTLIDPWETLGVTRDTSKEDLKKAYFDKVKQHHPDRVNDNGKMFEKIQEAYGILSNKTKLQEHLQELEKQRVIKDDIDLEWLQGNTPQATEERDVRNFQKNVF